jgi:N-acetyl sugar amidotransferase
MLRTCSKCIMDSNDDPDIVIDKQGICNHCISYDINLLKYYRGNDPELIEFHRTIELIKQAGKGKKYDAIIGLSGGVDSSFIAYLCFKYQVRALVFHLDNGWNSELSVVNIKNILKVTKFDLFTKVINWNEFKDLQRAYFKANVVDIEVLTDHAILTAIQTTAKNFNIPYILSGESITTEGRLPSKWRYNKSDSINIQAIHQKFGELNISSYPIGNVIKQKIFGNFGKSMNLLDMYPYQKEEAKRLITECFNWRDYGGKHYESVFTRFYQAYILPKKFKIDKRKSHYSTLICAGQLKREDALNLMSHGAYNDPQLEKKDLEFVTKKLGFSPEDFELYIQSPRIEHEAYKSYEAYLNLIRPIYRFIRKISFR